MIRESCSNEERNAYADDEELGISTIVYRFKLEHVRC